MKKKVDGQAQMVAEQHLESVHGAIVTSVQPETVENCPTCISGVDPSATKDASYLDIIGA